MGREQEAAVRKVLALFDAGASAAVHDEWASHFADDATYQPVVPLAPIVRGRAAILAELRGRASQYHHPACEIHTIVSSDDRVFTERTDTVTMLADDRKITVHTTGVFELDEDARIVAWREYWDLAAVARQLGIAAEAMPVVAAAS